MEHKIVDYQQVKNELAYMMYGTCTEFMRFTYDKIKQGTLPANLKMFDVTSDDGECAKAIVAYNKEITPEFMGTLVMDARVDFKAPIELQDDYIHTLYMLTTPGDQHGAENSMMTSLIEGGVIPYVQEQLDDGTIIEHPLSIADAEELEEEEE